MAFDAELQIVHSQVVDVSVGTEQLSSSVAADVLALEGRGLVDDSYFFVVIEAVTAAAAGANVVPVKFVLQLSEDNGATYVDVCTIQFNTAASLAKQGVWQAPVGIIDDRIDTRSVQDSKVRVAVRYTDNVETDDFTYSAYLGGPGGHFPSNDAADA